MKYRIALVTSVIIMLVVVLVSYTHAHSGKVDSQGGHYNRSTGEYHYHHGYSAHDHYDMDGDGKRDCPYDFKDKTNHSSTSKNNNKTVVNKNTNSKKLNGLTFRKIIIQLIGVTLSIGFFCWLIIRRR